MVVKRTEDVSGKSVSERDASGSRREVKKVEADFVRWNIVEMCLLKETSLV